MLKARVIPCLDVKDGRVVKGVRFVDLVDAGDPVEQARSYDAEGADELTFLDITASSDKGLLAERCKYHHAKTMAATTISTLNRRAAPLRGEDFCAWVMAQSLEKKKKCGKGQCQCQTGIDRQTHGQGIIHTCADQSPTYQQGQQHGSQHAHQPGREIRTRHINRRCKRTSPQQGQGSQTG